MWKLISLSNLEYKEFNSIIQDFKNDISKLILLQQSGNVPLIISCRHESMHTLSIAPDTLEVLSEIDPRFEDFNKEATYTIVDMDSIDSQVVLFGHKETFRKYYSKKALLLQEVG